jgi:predicted O-methyltransferase YrrM
MKIDYLKNCEYIDGFLGYPNDVLVELEKEHKSDRVNIQPNIGLQAAHLLKIMLLLTNAKRVLEIGTCIGYSSIFIGEFLKMTGGKLTTIEIDKRFIPEITANIKAAGLKDSIEVINQDAATVVDNLPPGYDLILLDANKPLYLKIRERLVDLLRVGGVIVADDTLFKPMGAKERLADPMDKYNTLVFKDKRLQNTILPIGDGITLSIKTSE